MMHRLITLAGVIALSLSCCPPPEWESRVFVYYSSFEGGNPTVLQITSDMAYDGNKRMLYTNQSYSTGMRTWVWQDFNNTQQFVISTPGSGRCEKMALTFEEQGCVPKNATVISKSYMGPARSLLNVTMYEYVLAGGVAVHKTVTDDGCLPVTLDRFQGSLKMTLEYFNVKEGLTDASVFTIPDTCKKL